MPDQDPFAEAQEGVQKSRTRCEFCPAVAELSKRRRDQLHDAMMGKTLVNGKNVTLVTIQEVLASWGIRVNQSTLSRHKTGASIATRCKNSVMSKWESYSDDDE